MPMSNPAHHVPEDLLVEYALGLCAGPAALSVACHLSLCLICNGHRRELEALGGALLETVAPVPTRPGALEQLLSQIDSLPTHPRSEPVPAVGPEAESLLRAAGVPPFVFPYLADPATAKWARLVPGVKRIDLRIGPPATVARLVALKPGLEIPLHDHGGTEFTVIFSGALSDEQGRFGRGDISIREPGECHVQRVEASEVCVALVINQGPLVPLTWMGRVLQLISRS
jgi:putative transcriptional regulator